MWKSHKRNAKNQFDWKKQNIKKLKHVLPYTKIGKQIVTFGDVEIEKHKFYRYKSPIF